MRSFVEATPPQENAHQRTAHQQSPAQQAPAQRTTPESFQPGPSEQAASQRAPFPPHSYASQSHQPDAFQPAPSADDPFQRFQQFQAPRAEESQPPQQFPQESTQQFPQQFAQQSTPQSAQQYPQHGGPAPEHTQAHGPQAGQAPHQFPQSQAEDPYKPFVTAGQISGPKTPPAHRQQELWNTVFGENYRAIDEYEDEPGRPIWLFALVGTVVLALVGALVWAFVAGPLASDDAAADDTQPVAKPPSSAAPAKPQSQTAGLPAFKGTPSPVTGALADPTAHVSVPRLGGPWQLDRNPQAFSPTYGFTTRQYVPAGMTTRGKREFAQVMTGVLPQSLASTYTAPDKLSPVVSAVMYKARQSLFPKGNKATKIGQQRLSRGGLTGLLVAYKVEADHEETTVAVAAVNAGGERPSVVYMAVPALKEDLLPDITAVFRSIKKAS
ncbi:hypothetical protein JOL79_22805 [Microbispora sp. RL4-1S]|uniref:Uncharacterized protein n=1 Tax=Microbispora oryzae TaxID=2806554 RepID=A0A940WKH3_9ACTN|nr:hypothetical protein [Microbispora oryzae]MBP2706643.1 hypothetical protein [Microbispora oryzae]